MNHKMAPSLLQNYRRNAHQEDTLTSFFVDVRHGVYRPDVARRVLQRPLAGRLSLHELAVLLEAEAHLAPHVAAGCFVLRQNLSL